jgi:hypothetical protein
LFVLLESHQELLQWAASRPAGCAAVAPRTMWGAKSCNTNCACPVQTLRTDKQVTYTSSAQSFAKTQQSLHTHAHHLYPVPSPGCQSGNITSVHEPSTLICCPISHLTPACARQHCVSSTVEGSIYSTNSLHPQHMTSYDSHVIV